MPLRQTRFDDKVRSIAGTVSTDVYDLLYRRWTTESQSKGALFLTRADIPPLPSAGCPVDCVFFSKAWST